MTQEQKNECENLFNANMKILTKAEDAIDSNDPKRNEKRKELRSSLIISKIAFANDAPLSKDELSKYVGQKASALINDGFEVVGVDKAGDAEEYAKGIKQFTKGYTGLYEKYMDWEYNEPLIEEAKKEYIKMYIDQNSLDVKYYKEFGWDPVKIE